jgi:four helix bundle protein
MTTKYFGEELEQRCFRFAQDTGKLCRAVRKDIVIIEYCKQAVRASGSVGANYIEANESLSKKDFRNRARICRKEAKESRYWLRLIHELLTDKNYTEEFNRLIQEATELMLIFNSMVSKSSKRS